MYATPTSASVSCAWITAGMITSSQPTSAGPTLATIHCRRGIGSRSRTTSYCSDPSIVPKNRAPKVATSSAPIRLRFATARLSTSALSHAITATAVSNAMKARELFKIQRQKRRVSHPLGAQQDGPHQKLPRRRASRHGLGATTLDQHVSAWKVRREMVRQQGRIRPVLATST